MKKQKQQDVKNGQESIKTGRSHSHSDFPGTSYLNDKMTLQEKYDLLEESTNGLGTKYTLVDEIREILNIKKDSDWDFCLAYSPSRKDLIKLKMAIIKKIAQSNRSVKKS